MNVNHKLELLDQLDDAAFALMMDEYAEAEGERLRAEFEAATRAGLTPPKPEGLDEKCRKMIKAEYGKARWAEYGARARKMAVKAAAMVLIGIGIAAAMVMSVEAFRVPFFKFITTHYDGYSSIDFNDTTPQAPSTSTHGFNDLVYDVLPAGFETIYSEIQNGRLNALYTDNQGGTINISMRYSTIEPSPDDNETNPYVDIGGVIATYTTENGQTLRWYNPEIETEFSVWADMLSEEEFMDLCEHIIVIYQNAALVNGGGPENPLPAVLPADYQEIYSGNLDGLLSAMYKADDGRMFYFWMDPMEGTRNFDTENATVTDTTVLDYDAIYIKKDDETGGQEVIWFDEERNVAFTLLTEYISESDFWSLCEYLAEYYKDVTLPAVSTVILP